MIERAIIVLVSIIIIALLVGTIGCSTKHNDTKGFIDNKLRVMTINVWSGLNYIGTFRMGEYESSEIRVRRYQTLVKEIKRINPDIIAINEANYLPDYIEKLSHDIDYDFIYHVGVAGLKIGRFGIPTNLKEGDAILARKNLQLQEIGHKQLSGGGIITNFFSFHTQDATQVLIGRVIVYGKPVYVGVTHLHASPLDTAANRKLLSELKEKYGYSNEDYKQALAQLEADNAWRMDECKTLVQYCQSVITHNEPFILMGDFNSIPEMPDMQYLFSQGYTDTYIPMKSSYSYTWDPVENANIKKYYSLNINKKFDSLYTHLNKIHELEPKRIDYILVNRSVNIANILDNSICCNTVDGLHPSDHFGVYADIKIYSSK